jgi:hypothetical protein
LAHIVNYENPQTFFCKYIENGYITENYNNTGYRILLDEGGNMVSKKDIGTMITYCCTSETDENGITNVVLVYWDKVMDDEQ